ncbi:hypothetical protein [Streptosporangium sp. NPDC049376]|uniref:hypothetical protein n=1 Tax=Streptosporangium sp. NPDC049376 TaxID=3366192 RepID=UPI0037B53B97
MRPEDAWRLVISTGVEPPAAVDEESEDHLGEVNRQWENVARRNGVIDRDGTFLPSPSGAGRLDQPGDVRLAQELALDPGEPEFVTRSNPGNAVIGVTAEEHSTWIRGMDHLTDQKDKSDRSSVLHGRPDPCVQAKRQDCACRSNSPVLRGRTRLDDAPRR